ncbi:hypothetical protein BY458DRAFT_437618 [Sporodiniella umbellata]|nr:hypothetical protein BY458DRAFT_437649 [Sporodiniella umbellata]KAI9266109.1 hypothetical protein BY458DRAFT_437618 [Sporodiniella umbellata]
MSLTLEAPLAHNILNSYFENVSYVKGVELSEADVSVFNALTEGVSASAHPHLARWYSHVAAVKGLAAKISAVPTDAPTATAEEEEEDIDLFGSDEEEDAEAERIKAQRVAEYNARKANKPKTIAKTTITLEIKPWDDETDMDALTAAVRAIAMDGLLWGGSQFVPIGYGIRKLQINCVVEDDKVLLDDLTEQITDLEDFVQSVDIAAMQKI